MIGIATTLSNLGQIMDLFSSLSLDSSNHEENYANHAGKLFQSLSVNTIDMYHVFLFKYDTYIHFQFELL